MEDEFQRKWSNKDKKCPSLTLLLAILNPSLNERFTNYKLVHNGEKDTKTLLKRLFFGTNLDCDLHNYQIPCKNSESCGVCSLALQGFGKLGMSGVPLHKNPGVAHEHASLSEGPLMFGLLMCEVACGNVKRLKSRTMSDTEDIRAEGYDAVSFQRVNSLFKNYTDEVVVYNTDAICPRYILLYV